MPAEEGLGIGHVAIRGAEGQYSNKTSPRPTVYQAVTPPQSCYSSSGSSVSSEMIGLQGPLRSAESLSSPGSRALVFCDSVVSLSGTPSSSSVSSARTAFIPQEHSYRLPSNSSPVSRSSVFLQHNYSSDYGITPSTERNYNYSPVVIRGGSPDSTPTVTISRHISPSTSSVGRLRSSPTLSAASPLSNAASPSVPSNLLPSICTTLPSSSLSSSLSLSFPSVSRSPYMHHNNSPSTTRIVRSTSTASSTLHPSPTPRSASVSLRISEASSNTLEQLGNSNNSTPGSSLSERGTRVHNLALTYLTSHDSVPPCLHSPPPSYDQLCNPNALPTYQEATQSSRQRGDARTVFTLPSNAEHSNTDPLLQTFVVQDSERGLRGGVLASLAAELSDSEGGYSTILDAIPHEHAREPCPAVPVRFLRTCSLNRLRPPKIQPPCLTSVCNKALVRKELNRRWPFIAGAQEDDHCPGLILVECSSHLTVAHLPELPRATDGSTGGVNTSFNVSAGSNINMSAGDTFTDITLGSPVTSTAVTTTIDLDTAALTSQVLFYLCGKCVNYDSFDRDNVRSHIEYDCPGSSNHWGNMSELYLVLRAVVFVIIVIFVFVWLPYLGI